MVFFYTLKFRIVNRTVGTQLWPFSPAVSCRSVKWNNISAIIGINITNIAKAPFVYAANYWVGAKCVMYSGG